MDKRPRVRYVDAFPIEADGQQLIYLRDPEGLVPQSLAVPPHVYFLMTLMDGVRTVRDLRGAFARQFNGMEVPAEQVEALIQQLDEAYLLDSDRFRRFRRQVEAEFRNRPTREAAHAGKSYPDDGVALREAIDAFFEPPEGPGRPAPGKAASPVRALIAPHIDFQRGGPCFAWAYKALAESPPPDVFVVLGTGHSARYPFVLTRKDFETPLGTLQADQAVIDHLVQHISHDLFVDEFAHKEEHSIEFQAVFLKYLYPDRDISFVPILCGSFHEWMQGRRSPRTLPIVSDFLEALTGALAATGRRACFIAGVDLSHVGQRFGDPEPLSDSFIEGVEQVDRALLRAAEALDPERFIETISHSGDRTRVCGTSSIYTMLCAMDAHRGALLKYDQAIDREAQSMVSFTSMAFY